MDFEYWKARISPHLLKKDSWRFGNLKSHFKLKVEGIIPRVKKNGLYSVKTVVSDNKITTVVYVPSLFTF